VTGNSMGGRTEITGNDLYSSLLHITILIEEKVLLRAF
jgi:hypothetical protein